MPVGPPQPIDRHEQFFAAILSELRAIRAVLEGPEPFFPPPPETVELREAEAVDVPRQKRKYVRRKPYRSRRRKTKSESL